MTCGGRAQDLFEVETKVFLEKLQKGVEYNISRKKTNVVHYYFPDATTTPFILPFVEERLEKGVKFVWGSLEDQRRVSKALGNAFKLLFSDADFDELKPTRTHTFRHTVIAQLQNTQLNTFY